LVGCEKGDVGHWSGIELFHTPPLGAECIKRFRGGQCVEVDGRWPWHFDSKHRGRWQVVRTAGEAVVQGGVEIEQASSVLPAEEQVPSVEPAVCPPVPMARPTTVGALTIQCWSLPGPETELARIERVMAAFVEQLLAAGVVLPDNFERVGCCGARTDPQPCHIYRFGGRRLHINVREAEGGRLCLVVRCGGGFLDFAEFARKNGNMEQLKLQRMQGQRTQGREVLRVASVLSHRERRIKDVSSSNAPRSAVDCRRRA